jgi:hypothetical protein
MIRFFTFKRLKARAIHTELESMYGPEALALPTVNKWWRCFHSGRTDLFDNPRSGSLLTNDPTAAIGFYP